MNETPDDDAKEHEATQKRLDDARRQGEVPRSQDLVTAASFGGFLLAVVTTGPGVVDSLGRFGSQLIGRADQLAPELLQGGRPFAGALFAGVLWPLSGLFLLPAAAAVLALLVQRALIVTPENLMPRMSRINPVAAFSHKFGPDGLIEFGKSSAKLIIVSALTGLFLNKHLDALLGTIHLEPGQGAAVLAGLLTDFMSVILLILFVFGVFDYLWQRLRHAARHRMSRKEIMDESKESEGDPHVKSQRRQRAQEIAMNQMLADVPKADVVILNPTHYAVALKWDRGRGRAPVCVAKGVDEIAARIRERAAEAGVPLHADPPTARALYATLAVGEEIKRDQYRAVAAAIRFAEAMRKRAREKVR